MNKALAIHGAKRRLLISEFRMADARLDKAMRMMHEPGCTMKVVNASIEEAKLCRLKASDRAVWYVNFLVARRYVHSRRAMREGLGVLLEWMARYPSDNKSVERVENFRAAVRALKAAEENAMDAVVKCPMYIEDGVDDLRFDMEFVASKM